MVAECDGKQYGICNTIEDTRYRPQCKDKRGCMRNHSMGPTSGGWVSQLRVLKTKSPVDEANYSYVANNGRETQQTQGTSLAINGMLFNEYFV